MRAMYSPSKLRLIMTATCLPLKRYPAGITQRCQKHQMPPGAPQPSLRQSGSQMTLKRSVGQMSRMKRKPAQVISHSEIRWRKEKEREVAPSAPASICDDDPTRSILSQPNKDFAWGVFQAGHPVPADPQSITHLPNYPFTTILVMPASRVLDPLDDLRQGWLLAVHQDADAVNATAQQDQAINRYHKKPDRDCNLPGRNGIGRQRDTGKHDQGRCERKERCPKAQRRFRVLQNLDENDHRKDQGHGYQELELLCLLFGVDQGTDSGVHRAIKRVTQEEKHREIRQQLDGNDSFEHSRRCQKTQRRQGRG